MALSGSLSFGQVPVGSKVSLPFTIANTGNAPLTVTSLSYSGVGSGASSPYTASVTSGVIQAGASLQVVVFFAPSSTTTYSGTVTVSADQTSGANTLAVSGTGTGTTQPAPLYTLTGTVTDATSRGVLPGVTVEVASGANDGQGVLTDANGKYTLTGLSAGVFSVSAGATSYLTTTSPVTLAANAQLNFVVQRTTASSSPSTTRTRVGATCTDGWISTATGSGACSSHGGVRCWRYTDGACTNP